MLGHRVRHDLLSPLTDRRSVVVAALLASALWPIRAEDAGRAPATADGPHASRERLAERRALGATGRAPRFPRWRRGELLSVEGIPMPWVTSPFAGWIVGVRRTPELYPPTVAEPELWAESQEQLLAVGECACSGGSGFPGEVPARTLRLSKNVGSLDLSWSSNCSADANDYSVHEGTLGAWYTHAARACSTGGALAWTLVPGFGNRYFLVVPTTADDDGSFGRDGQSAERPASSPSCRPTALAGACP